jgi:hypothetical protein
VVAAGLLQQRQHQHRAGARAHADAQRADAVLLHAPLGAQFVGVEHDAARAFERLAAMHRPLDAPTDAVEQRQLQLDLERADAAAERRLAEVHGLRRPAERGLIGQRDQVAQLDQRHRRLPLEDCSGCMLKQPTMH